MNLYMVTYRCKNKLSIWDCSWLCLAPNLQTAKKMPTWFYEGATLIRRTVKARLIQSEAEIGIHPDCYAACFVEDCRDYDSGQWDENYYGKFLDSKISSERPLIQDLREQWRREENERMANRLQLRLFPQKAKA